ncbi:MAG: Eco57I restriction-modification methylase domain-containing protein, partial [Deltaproteobacteria bacterium]|nr:Eco57I restriction-modification methylase domain-containing protein [Deltaproteobacteria bacterium]
DDDWDTGSKHFLRELFEKKHGDYNNFFNDILEPLFYDALRNDRSHDDGYYSRFNCKIPFLNGGLFDPIGNYDWVHTDILLPNKLFSNQTKTKEGDIGTGILDVFDRYNFTVKEDEPLEKEVAIDPELLGKSYEKFNAIRPDNFAEFKKALKSGRKGEENKFNKKFGVFYTPREIVHYMCQQSLINYLHAEVIASETKQSLIPSKEDIEALIHTGEQVSENEAIFLEKEQKIKKGEQKTTSIKSTLPDSIRKNAKQIDDKLAEITVCDPAVGSGAFPVGMMSEIVKTRNVLTPFLSLREAQVTKQSHFDDKRTAYNFKRRCIEHSLYGVDIDPGAVEIAKLRLWLSLVVDEDDIKNIKPLPNLDYRIMQGNSLISEFMGINFDDNENNNLKKEIEELNAEIKTLKKEKSDKESKSSRHYKKTIEIDQNLLNEINILDDKINKLKNKRTLLNKKLNHQEESPEIINLISEFQKKKNTFLNESNVSRKTQLKNEVDVLLIKIFETKLKTQKADYFNSLKNIENKYSVVRNEKQRDELIKQDKEKFNKKSGFDLESAEKQLKEFTSGRQIKPFFLWNLYFSEVFHNKGGFDVVIGNPPYYNIKTATKDLFKYLAAHYNTIHTGYNDIVYYFIYLGIELLKKSGCSVLITSNYYLGNEYAKKLRTYLNNHVSKIINFKDNMVFDSASIHTCISISLKVANSDEIIFFENTTGEQITTNNIESALRSFVIRRADLNDNWIIADQSTASVVKKLNQGSVALLGDISTIEKGSTSGKNDVYTVSNKLAKKMKLEDSVLRKNIKNGDIDRYTICDRDNFLIYVDSHTTIEDFPNIYSYLKKHKKVLLNRNEVKKGLYPWYRLERPRKKTIFDTHEKIVVPYRAEHNRFAYDNQQYFNDGGDIRAIVIKSPKFNIKYILAILNSRLIDWFYGFIGKPKGKVKEYFNTPLSLIPIKEISLTDQQPFIRLVDLIISEKKINFHVDTSTLEAEIDQRVYKLYDLTEEEIEIVETSS